MANGFTTDRQEDILDHFLGTASYTMPAAVYTALFIGDPTDGGTEVSGVDYAREATTFAAATTSGDISTASNSAAIDFGTAGGDWGTVTHTAIYDAITAGNLIAAGALTTSRTIQTGDPVKFNIGELDVTQTRNS